MRRTLTILGLMLMAGAARAADTPSVDADGTVTIRPGEAFEIAFPDGDLAPSICPVLPGTLGYEQWMDAIEELKLSNFRKSDPGQMVCD